MNKIAVIKYDGNVFEEKSMNTLINNVKYLRKLKYKVIICHNFLNNISGVFNEHNESVFDRYDFCKNDVLNVGLESILNKIDLNIIKFLNKNGLPSISINGTDSFFIKSFEKKGYIQINDIDCDLIYTLIEKDYIPVISPIGCDDLGNCYNLDSNMLASKLSMKVGADIFIIMSDYSKLYEVIDGRKRVITTLDYVTFKKLLKNNKLDYNFISKINFLMDYSKYTKNCSYLINTTQELNYSVFQSKFGIKVCFENLNVRIALKEDIPNILKLMRDSFPKYQSYIEYKIYPLIEDEFDLYSDMLNNLFFVYYKNSKLIGHIRFKVEEDNARIYRVCVDPRHQNKGIGSILLKYVENYAKMKGLNSIGLTTIGGVDYLSRFYSKNGYKLYSNNDSRGYDRVLLIKNLKNNDIIDTNWFYLK